jgi:hypothetical protein
MHFFYSGNCSPAGWAPRCPEINHYYLPPVIRETYIVTAHVLKFEISGRTLRLCTPVGATEEEQNNENRRYQCFSKHQADPFIPYCSRKMKLPAKAGSK